MAAVVPEHPTRPARGPCLTVAPSAGPVISILFALTIVLFVLGLIAL